MRFSNRGDKICHCLRFLSPLVKVMTKTEFIESPAAALTFADRMWGPSWSWLALAGVVLSTLVKKVIKTKKNFSLNLFLLTQTFL